MPRGRPPKPKPDASKLTQDQLNEVYEEAIGLKSRMDTARSVYQNCFKRAETLGINRAALSRVIREAARDRDKREIDHQDFVRYMQWIGKPVGTQLAMDLGEPTSPTAANVGRESVQDKLRETLPQEEREAEDAAARAAAGPSTEPGVAEAEDVLFGADAEEQEGSAAFKEGVYAGKLGVPATTCPFVAGGELYSDWVKGYERGTEISKAAQAEADARRSQKNGADAPAAPTPRRRGRPRVTATSATAGAA